MFLALETKELDLAVKEVTKEYPFSGESMIKQILADKGIKLQRMRLRDSIHTVDHTGVESRKKGCLRRRVHNVEGPNHLWYIDTNHKLVR